MEPEDTPEAVGDGSEEEGVNILTFVQASIIPSVTRSPRSPSRNCLLLPNLASTGRFYIGQVLDLYKRGRYVAPIPATAPSSWLQLHRVCLGCLMCLLTCTFTTGAYISFCVHNNFISNIPFLDSWWWRKRRRKCTLGPAPSETEYRLHTHAPADPSLSSL